MESRKKNWNTILNNTIASISLILVTLLLSICFIVPKTTVNALDLTKDNIQRDYGIYFVSAKTKVRSASNLQKTTLKGINPNDKKDSEFDAYTYNYNSNTDNIYYGTTAELNTLSNGSDIYTPTTLFEKFNGGFSRSNGYIPYNINYFDNVSGEKEEIFYDEIKDGDYVLLDNNTSHLSATSGAFNVENFYLSMGTPFITDTTTPLQTLRVDGMLYANGMSHYLLLNETEQSSLEGGKKAEYWNQYFDINYLRAYKYNEQNPEDQSATYNIDNVQGKYVINFHFIRYDNNLNPVDAGEEHFTYTFYLLDGSEYSTYPTIDNASILTNNNTLTTNKTVSYYYNFTKDYPTINYDPSKYNVSYSRLSNRTLTNYNNVTSTFHEQTYSDSNGTTYPLGIVSYFNSSTTPFKTVYILTHYNTERTIVEYLYLSVTNSNPSTPTSLATFNSYLNNETLDFEYKITVVREKENTTYTTSTYRTEDYSKISFVSTIDNVDDAYTKIDEYKIVTATTEGNQVTYTLENNSTSTTLATLDEVRDQTFNLTPSASLPMLDNIINLERIKLCYSYELKLQELGEYTINYAYVCPSNDSGTTRYYINSTEKVTENSYSSQSTDITTPRDYTVTLTNSTSTNSPSTTSDLYYVTTGIVGETTENVVTINGITYTYKGSDSLESNIDNKTYLLDVEYTGYTPFLKANSDNTPVSTTFSIDIVNGAYILKVRYKIGTITTVTTTTKYTSSLNDIPNYINRQDVTTSQTYNLTLSESAVPSTEDWQDLRDTLNTIDGYSKVEGSSTQAIKSQYITETLQGTAELHIFGSIAYFNEKTDTTDSGLKKLIQVDNRRNLNYNADVTSQLVPSVGNVLTYRNDWNNYVTSTFKGNIAQLVNKSNVIITDKTPIRWNNFSTLKYNDKTSLSYIFRYENYSFDEDGNLVYNTSSAETTSYTKDIYCQANGLYEVVVFYTYDGLPTGNTSIYYQVFTFIIDKSSPEIIIEVEQEPDTFVELGTNTYTNKNIRISWEVPSYFKNDVFIVINKDNYSASSSYEFVAQYLNGNITVQTSVDDIRSYVNQISSMGTMPRTINGTEKQYYYVLLDDHSNYDINGNYEVTVHYDNNGNSTFNAEFVIDKINISGLNLLPVVKNNNGTYEIDKTKVVKNSNGTYAICSSQIVNSDFTFRFDGKESGANIYAYYNKIDFTSTKDYDKIINSTNSKIGITTKFNVNGDSDSISRFTPYTYDTDSQGSVVDSKNLLTSNNSGLFLFVLEDEAGNTCRYIVFYDKTEPRFIISPEPDATTHTVTDTARVLWGDYKAIKIENSGLGDIDLIKNISNYSKETDEDLALVLRYINYNSNRFDGLKVEKINGEYYILVPINKVIIEDKTYANTLTISSENTGNSAYFINIANTNNYYFFTVNPLTMRDGKTYISLPNYDENGKVVNTEEKETTYEVESYTYKTINSRGSSVNRYIEVTYKVGESSKTIYGVFGDKGSSNPRDTYVYSLSDKVGNKTSSALTVTRDLTVTVAFGLFDYTDNVNKAVSLDSSDSAYSVSKMFISSKHSEDLPEFEVTYKHYPYDTSLYSQYNVQSVKLLTSTNNEYSQEQTIVGQETYLRLVMTHKTNSTSKTIYIQLTNSEGYSCPAYSYPYSLEGQAIIHDEKGNPSDVYSEGATYNNDRSRIYSLALNTTTDTNKQKVVTAEGLYIFQRTYTENVDQDTLGDDSKIAYYVYYVDRSGIINISASNDTASGLYAGNGIGFTLGSNYTTNYNKTNIGASTIQNNQTIANKGNTSNSDYISQQLFDTNKIQVEFRVPYDKYNFKQFELAYKDAFTNAIDSDSATKNQVADILKYQLFDVEHFQNNIYKTDLTLMVGGDNTTGSIIIDEQDGRYSTAGLNAYLKGTPMVNANTRGTSFDFFYDVGSNYYIVTINDQAGYRLYNTDGSTTENYLANKLKITFDISHDAPEGELYGKYYGRHDYDNNTSFPSNSSIPTDTNGNYAILSKYLSEGQLEPLSDTEKSSISTSSGDYIKLYSTNNETMIFTFYITPDEYRATIDPNNIKIYKVDPNFRGGNPYVDSNLILNRVNGNFRECQVSARRQQLSFIENIIGGVTYYAIVIFDNNLDEILDEDEKNSELAQYRLLDSDKYSNPDKATYYIQINYVGDENDYRGEDSQGNPLSFYNSTYEIIVDRVKPTYNLTKLMAEDKYVYNTITAPVSSTNYESLFEQYQSIYNFQLDEDYDFYRSDLETYFFALDCRENTSFLFESIDELDNDSSMYIRPIADKNNYKFSVTPDDYKAYYTSVYLQGHPQFTPSNAIPITQTTLSQLQVENNKYYKVQFSLDDADGKDISANYLMSVGIFKENCYYEIIEEDETGNYRVYAVYIPSTSDNKVVYTYQENSNISSEQTVTILYGSIPYVESNGMKLHMTKINMKDNFLRANITIKTEKITHLLNVMLDPNSLMVTIFNRTTNTTLNTYTIASKDQGSFANTEEFVNAINYVLDYYYSLINDSAHAYYSQYGYNVTIEIVDRTGINIKDSNNLYNYQIDYAVTGSILTPKFRDNATNFTMSLEGQKGSTYLTEIVVYKFNQQWHIINVDNHNPSQSFDLPPSELKKAQNFVFTRGVYKFVFTDNFNRVNEFFYEYGTSSTVAGGSLDFGGNTSTTLSDGYTYSANSIKYTYDSSVYNVYIKFAGEYLDEYSEVQSINELVYSSSNTYSAGILERYGITVVTSSNITTITFLTPNVSYLSKYHIKTIRANTSDGYTWGLEETNKDIFVYDKQIAICTAIKDMKVANLSGNYLDTSEKLNLTEDFKLVTAWNSNVPTYQRQDFNSRIILTRTYNDNGVIRTITSTIPSGQTITQAGEYTAYVINDLGMTSDTISFTRGEGEITMYAVYAVDSQNSIQTQLSPSSYVTYYGETSKSLYTFYITSDYFNYKNLSDQHNTFNSININNFAEYLAELTSEDRTMLSSIIGINASATKYLDVRINSNLNIKATINDIGFISGDTYEYPYIEYQIYSDSSSGTGVYTYKYIQIIFVKESDATFVNATVHDADNDMNLAEKNATIQSASESVKVEIELVDINRYLLTPLGNTIYIDRYYNGSLVETTVLNPSDRNELPSFSMIISRVGLHEFVVRDLAGRTHKFNGNNKLQIYLINQVQFTTNGESPINNQVFNGSVNFEIDMSETSGVSSAGLSGKITKNGIESSIDIHSGKFTVSGAGYYTIKMYANIRTDIISATISTTYNFVIVDTEIAISRFSISKSSNFTIEKIIKVVGYDQSDITDTYTTTGGQLILFDYQDTGNCIFDVTLKKYDDVISNYRSFNFRIWINDEEPIILASLPAGTSTKDTIIINYNAGIMYSQIGSGYITLNDQVITEINSSSQLVVDSITIDKKGTYWLKIYSNDGTLRGSYKFVKSEPLNSVTKIVLVCVAIGILVVIVIFFLIRRRGKYR